MTDDPEPTSPGDWEIDIPFIMAITSVDLAKVNRLTYCLSYSKRVGRDGRSMRTSATGGKRRLTAATGKWPCRSSGANPEEFLRIPSVAVGEISTYSEYSSPELQTQQE